jgi:hypothetical protein
VEWFDLQVFMHHPICILRRLRSEASEVHPRQDKAQSLHTQTLKSKLHNKKSQMQVVQRKMEGEYSASIGTMKRICG